MALCRPLCLFSVIPRNTGIRVLAILLPVYLVLILSFYPLLFCLSGYTFSEDP